MIEDGRVRAILERWNLWNPMTAAHWKMDANPQSKAVACAVSAAVRAQQARATPAGATRSGCGAIITDETVASNRLGIECPAWDWEFPSKMPKYQTKRSDYARIQ